MSALNGPSGGNVGAIAAIRVVPGLSSYLTVLRVRLPPSRRGPASGIMDAMPSVPRPGLRVTPNLLIPEAELSWRFSRSSGPGGQGVNTADSRVELVWDAGRSAALSSVQRERLLARLGGRLVDGVLTIAASEHRAQLRNREAARERLATLIAEAVRPPAAPRRPTKPSRGSKERRLDAKHRRTDVKKMRQRPRDA